MPTHQIKNNISDNQDNMSPVDPVGIFTAGSGYSNTAEVHEKDFKSTYMKLILVLK